MMVLKKGEKPGNGMIMWKSSPVTGLGWPKRVPGS